MDKKILIIGPGKLGTSLYRFLCDLNIPEPALCGPLSGEYLKSPLLNNNHYHPEIDKILIENHELIFICTQDSKIEAAVNALSKYDLKNKYIIHTSGFHSSELHC